MLRSLTAVMAILLGSGTFAQVDPLDPSFGTGGLITLQGSFGEHGEVVLPYDDGRLLVVSRVFSMSFERVKCTRLLPDGSIDPGFGNGGAVELDMQGADLDVSDGVLLPDGSVMLCGEIRWSGGPTNGMVVRLLPDGSFDPAFGLNGKAFLSDFELLRSIVVLPDGSVIAGGRDVTYDPVILKLNASGQLDFGFGTNGFMDLPGSRNIWLLERTPGGEVLALGDVQDPVYKDLYFVKFTTDGNPVTSFGNNGEVIFSIAAYNDIAVSLQVLDDGRMMVGAASDGTSDPYVARFNADGTLDATFGVAGVTGGSMLPNGSFIFKSAITTVEGTFIIGYRAMQPVLPYVARLDANGDPVPSFGDNGTFTVINSSAALYSACATALGQVVVTGFEHVGLDATLVARLLVSSAEGMNDVQADDALTIVRLSPDIVRVQADEPIVMVRVMDACGRLVEQFGANGTRTLDVSTRGLGAGMFSVVAGTSRTTQVGRFVQSE